MNDNSQPSAANTIQEGGDHYKLLDPQPWDVIAAWNMDFFAGNALKYLARYQHKGGIEDLKKARHYLDKQIEREQQRLDDELDGLRKTI